MKKFKFEMTAGEYFIKTIIVTLLVFASIFTLFIALPWVLVYYNKWYYEHVTYEGKEVKYIATGKELFKESFIVLLLTLITLGIYTFWGFPRMQRFHWDHIVIVEE